MALVNFIFEAQKFDYKVTHDSYEVDGYELRWTGWIERLNPSTELPPSYASVEYNDKDHTYKVIIPEKDFVGGVYRRFLCMFMWYLRENLISKLEFQPETPA
jgi:hypothetical protein